MQFKYQSISFKINSVNSLVANEHLIKRNTFRFYQSNLSLVRLFPCESCTPFHGESWECGSHGSVECPGFFAFFVEISPQDFCDCIFPTDIEYQFHLHLSTNSNNLRHDKKAQSSTKFSPPKYANF